MPGSRSDRAAPIFLFWSESFFPDHARVIESRRSGRRFMNSYAKEEP
jgi:hypothetical protein